MKKTVRFFTRVLALAFLLLSFVILDAALMGALPLIGALCLLPGSLLLTGKLFALSLKKPARRRAARPDPLPGGAARARRELRVWRSSDNKPGHTHVA